MNTEVEICAAKCGVFGPPGTGKSHFKAILSGKKRPTGGRHSTALATEADQIIPVVDIGSEFADEFLEMHTITTQSQDGSNIKWYVTNNKKLDGLVAKTLYKQKTPDSSIVIQERPVSNRSLRRRVLKQIRQLIQKNPKLSKLKCLKGMRLIYIVDTGGQPQFQEIMPMFVRSSSIHFLVHKLNEPLDECPRFDYEISGIKYTVPDKMLVSNRTYIEQSLRTISSCVFARNSGRYTCGSNPKPHFGIIGMFKDKCRDTAILDKKRSEVNECIQPYVITKPRKCEAFTPSRHNEKPIFSIDGSEEGWSSNGNVIDDLHTNIENFTKSVKIRVPVRWFLFLNLLKEQKNRPFMSLQECEDMAKKENIMMNEKDDVIEALELFDELNLVLYFSKFLPNVVFISPAFLLNKVSEIIVQSFNCDAPNTGISSEDRIQFRTTGIFERSMMQKVKSLQQGLNDTFSQDHLFELLKQLCIVADIADNQRLFIPCVLALEDDDVNSQFLQLIIDHMRSAKVEPLTISFPDGYSPRGLFCASIAFLAKLPNWSIESHSSTLRRRRNLIEFEVSECTQHGQNALSVVPLGTVVIVDRMSHIEVYSTCDRKFLCDIRRNINKALWYAATKCLAYSPTSMKVGVGFSCAIDCGYPETHGTAVQDKDDPNWSMKCLKNSRKRAVKLNDRQLAWFTTPASDVMSGKLVQSSDHE
jgi:GTPase SAR1 family protein